MLKTILFSLSILFSLTLNAYSQWKVINSTIGVDIKALVKVNDGLMVATDGNGQYYSPNNESNWVQNNAGLTNLKVYCLDVDGNTIVAGTRGNGVFISKNGGNNWSATANGITVPHIYAVGLFGSTIVAGTGGGGIFLSLDEGKNWKANGGSTHIVNAITRFNNYAYMGQGPYAYKSTDNGQSWQNYIPQSNTTIKAFAESYKQNGSKNVIVGTLDGIYVSTDDGKSWKIQVNNNCTGLTTINNIVFASFENTNSAGAIAYSTDNGITWKVNDQGLPSQINARAITSDNEYVYFGSGDGVVWKRKFTDFGITSVENELISNDLAVYPNPAKDNTTIIWNMHTSDKVLISIFNHLGQEIYNLVNEYRTEGKNQISLDVSKMINGVYFLRLQIGSDIYIKQINLVN